MQNLLMADAQAAFFFGTPWIHRPEFADWRLRLRRGYVDPKDVLGVLGARFLSKGNTFENDLLLLIFNATAIANIADNAASSPLTTLQVGLHTSDPGEAGSQTTNETSYGSYARVAVNRNSGGWTVTANSVSPAATISFPACTSSTATVTHGHVGTASSGAGKVLYKGTITPNISVAAGVTPQLTTASAITED